MPSFSRSRPPGGPAPNPNECQVAHDELLFWSGVTCGSHLPSSVAFARGSNGLPIGVQVVARPYGDRTTIAVAGLIEALQGDFVAPPGWT